MADGEELPASIVSGGGLPDFGAGESGILRLYHGTDRASATDIALNGLDGNRAAAFNGSGEFWATVDVAMADTFAFVNPAGGIPARFDFDLPVAVLVGAADRPPTPGLSTRG